MSASSSRRAIISVYDKTGVIELAQELSTHGFDIVSTGSTARIIAEAGVKVTEVAQITGFPEILDGRVKTLHPVVHGGILANRQIPEHLDTLNKHEITPIDVVVGNLYPFSQTVRSGANEQEIIENIDIGGPTLIRAAAKNFSAVTVIVDPADYATVARIYAQNPQGPDRETRKKLASKAFKHIAQYDEDISRWFLDAEEQVFPGNKTISGQQEKQLRYGENPHQKAALYQDGTAGLASAKVLWGKEMSYNNFVDTDAAWRAAQDFTVPAAAVIKHANPCGIAVGETIEEAYQKAHATDPVSAYGGVIAVNRPVTAQLAQLITPVFTEVVIAPEFESDALEILQTKKNLRIVALPDYQSPHTEIRPITGGFLFQERDRIDAAGDDPQSWTLAAGEPADDATMQDLVFAWRAVRSVKSNAILLAKDQAAVGVGMGQVNRVDSAHLAVNRAGDRVNGSVASSDAFFPFADGLEILLSAGVKAVVQPGGSIRDEEVIAAAQKAGVTMYFTGTRHFAH